MRFAGSLCVLTSALLLLAPSASASPELDVGIVNDANEAQLLLVNAEFGQLRLCYEAECTGDLSVSASGTQVQNALNGLSSINAAGGSVSVDSGIPGYRIDFDGGPLAHTDVPLLEVVDGTSPLAGSDLGAAAVVSEVDPAGVSRSDQQVDYAVTVGNGGSDPTSGEVTLEVEVPAGQQTFVLEASGPGWTCVKSDPSASTPAKATCDRSDVLASGASYPAVTVRAALGADTPDQAVANATASCACAPTAATASDEFSFDPPKLFGLQSAEGGLFKSGGAPPFGDPYTQAGGHPFKGLAAYRFSLKRRRLVAVSGATTGDLIPVEFVRTVVADLPRGQVGNPLAVPKLCVDVDQIKTCPDESVVGGLLLVFNSERTSGVPIFAIEPEFGTPAQFAFEVGSNIYTLTAGLRPQDNYAVSLRLEPAPKVNVIASEVTLCNFGADVASGKVIGCKGATDADANPKPLFANPTRCDALSPPVVRTRLDSWEHPGVFAEKSFTTAPIEGCDEVEFDPEIDLKPSSSRADSPTGLDVELTMPTEGLETNTGISQANLKSARIAFPEGMAVNASAGHGLGACSLGQVKLGTNEPISCPDASKIGTVEIDTPLLAETLTGAAYIAEQGTVDDALIGLYFVFESKEDGIIVKLPAKVELDERTGRLTTIVDQSPEAPFSAVRMSFPGGDRATLLTPPKCGSYEIEAELVPWTAKDLDNPTDAEIVTDTTSFEVTEGPNGNPCPKDALLPTLNSGSTNPLAGQTSPFTMRLHREDGTDRFKALTLRPPAGLTAYLKGAALCPEPLIAKAQGREEPGEGQDELDNPSCPQASQLGRVIAGAGAGPKPFYVDHGKAYLAGPYKGAPLSILTIVPAVAGPLDLGNAVVRNAVHVDPKTAEIRVVSDPIPHILHGILLDVRDVRVVIDRPNFTNNPTSCAPKHIYAEVKGLVEDRIAQPSNPFQVGNCAALGFKPRTKVQLFGGVKRGKYQGVKAVVRPRPGDANISGAVVRFPRSAFVAQEHLKNICTRVQFAAEACPKSSIYGKAVAWSPLLDMPLRGNVHLRSSDNVLPDLVADLRGPAHQPIKVEVAIKNDSVKGALRNTVQAVPDAPVSYFRLQTFGGDKGLIVNSRNICGRNQARIAMGAHNGRRSVETVNVFNKRCKVLKRKQRAKRRKAKQRMQRAKARAAVSRASARHG